MLYLRYKNERGIQTMKMYGVNTGFEVVQMSADEVLDQIDRCME